MINIQALEWGIQLNLLTLTWLLVTGRLLGVFQKHDLSDDHVWLLPTEHDMSCFLAAPLASPSGRWGQTLCPIDAQTAILIGGQGARMQFCKDPMWKLCTGQSVQQHFRLSLILQLR